MSLPELQLKWIQLYDELGGNFESQVLAAPFVSMPEESSKGASVRPILLVGKATAGHWDKGNFDSMKDQPLTERLKERSDRTLKHLKEIRGEDLNSSAFWRFWRSLGQISQPVIWTNLAKIGVCRPEGDNRSKNPEGDFLTCQEELAQETLRAEMEEYKPALVVLVTSTYAAQEIAHPVFGPKNIWRTPDDSIWWQERTQTQPPVLWVDHPERKPNNAIDCWLEKARELIS